MAIDELLDEHEQGVRVQNWLRRNGPGLLLGLAIGLGALAAWSWYGRNQESEGRKDADRYAAAVTAIDADPVKGAKEIAAIESDSFKAMAQLHLAKAFATAGKNADAVKALQSVSGAQPTLQDIANVRLARLHIEMGKANDAIQLLNGKSTPEALEVLGDAHLASKQLDAARKAYTQALGKIDSASAQRPIIELKLTEAGGTPPTPTEAKS